MSDNHKSTAGRHGLRWREPLLAANFKLVAVTTMDVHGAMQRLASALRMDHSVGKPWMV